MLGITDLWAYVLGTVLIILVPGPNSLFALTMASTRGRKAGFAAAAGIVVGDLILMLAASLGVASLMKANPIAFDIVRYLGAAYLTYIGVRALLAKSQSNTPEVATTPHSAKKAFRSALGISLVNVKAILFFMAFFPQFVNPNYPHVWHTFAALGFIVQLVSISYLTTLILVGSSLARQLSAKIWLKTVLNKLVGTLFVSFGLRLALN
ncbi:leucine efflux protein LeuE [Deefgea salmonis]|uniref:Leucine efflux protein LeuE n=1 Tax=Deefgea salmonis TaxID=2875502 RepID=A0ABS8BJ86_9NEIS|nr:leucine efflux protein LeuE [Deefgea salmonis]MCB5195776.1 leucine efflux protein LeuE [Deefgea salmonis]